MKSTKSTFNILFMLSLFFIFIYIYCKSIYTNPFSPLCVSSLGKTLSCDNTSCTKPGPSFSLFSVEGLERPAQSSDLNLIQHPWDDLKDHLGTRSKSVLNLTNHIYTVWLQCPVEECSTEGTFNMIWPHYSTELFTVFKSFFTLEEDKLVNSSQILWMVEKTNGKSPFCLNPYISIYN